MIYKSPFVFLSFLSAFNAAIGPQHVVKASPLEASCSVAQLSKALPENATILSAEFLPAGGSYGEGAANPAFPLIPTDLPETCVVLVNVTTSETSSYRFGLFLPTTTWNQRYLTVGNGGFSGGINWIDMGAGIRYGFSVASTDMGHNSSMLDITWALGQPEKQLDFGFRATHGTTVLAKQLTESFYASKIKYSYYSGCSTGGRQGLKDAQLYPEDFNGLLVGAPAWWTAHLQTWTAKVGTYNLPQGAANHIDASLYPQIAADVVAQCDSADGVVDGIISAPHQCHLEADRLLCNDKNTTTCITPEQAQTVRNIHSNYTIDGEFAFPGLEVGSEGEWFNLLSGPEPASLGLQYIQNMLLEDPDWPWQNYTDSLVALADEKDPGNVTADDFDGMSRYLTTGGKVLLYHGLADGLIPTGSSTHFYNTMTRVLADAGEVLADSLRLFLIPGLHHCFGTSVNAPWYIAGPNQAGTTGTSTFSVPQFTDPKHDALMALMNWVEKGVSVESLIATTWNNSSEPLSGVLRQRPICPYPQSAVLKDAENINKAEAWVCE
ncbi:feruloyl esterase b [Colletotrichum truncatum]|uniref:Feruloyl esterase b n=1 Tax=Colletotrichum truncatum TaxID=5467 RepID=A0ACC3Z8U5_COLTU|nr:feruloyl esterase b [Colletotrichum truncatum]KAF6789317.1 feruloyl esterase b [Colletotrichum truncatum]